MQVLKLSEEHACAPEVLVSVAESHWYAVYTCSRHEKQVAAQFGRRHIEHLLPVYESVHRWKDRKVRVQLPLFPGYLFVHIAPPDRLRVLQVPSVVRLVGFNGTPVPLSGADIDALRNGLASGLRIEPHPYLQVGRRVRVRSGPMMGAEGELVRNKGGLRLVLSVELIQHSVAVEVDIADVEVVGS
jgi:transcription antitermination factor NusG